MEKQIRACELIVGNYFKIFGTLYYVSKISDKIYYCLESHSPLQKNSFYKSFGLKSQLFVWLITD